MDAEKKAKQRQRPVLRCHKTSNQKLEEARKDASLEPQGKHGPADTLSLISSFQNCERTCFKPPSLWPFVTVAWANQYTLLMRSVIPDLLCSSFFLFIYLYSLISFLYKSAKVISSGCVDGLS